MVQECRGPTATEPTAACWPILETTRCTVTGCWSRGASKCRGRARIPRTGGPRGEDTGTRWHCLLVWICCVPDLNMRVLVGTTWVVSCLFPNGACRKTSDVSTGEWDTEKEELLNAILLSFPGVLKGASWKTSEVTGLFGDWNWDTWLTGTKGRLVEVAGIVWRCTLLSSDGNVCLLWTHAAVFRWIRGLWSSSARSTSLLSSLCRSVCGKNGIEVRYEDADLWISYIKCYIWLSIYMFLCKFRVLIS